MTQLLDFNAVINTLPALSHTHTLAVLYLLAEKDKKLLAAQKSHGTIFINLNASYVSPVPIAVTGRAAALTG